VGAHIIRTADESLGGRALPVQALETGAVQIRGMADHRQISRAEHGQGERLVRTALRVLGSSEHDARVRIFCVWQSARL